MEDQQLYWDRVAAQKILPTHAIGQLAQGGCLSRAVVLPFLTRAEYDKDTKLVKNPRVISFPLALLVAVMTSSCINRAATLGDAGKHYFQEKEEGRKGKVASLLRNLRDLAVDGNLRDPSSVGAALGVRLLPPSGDTPSSRGRMFLQYSPVLIYPYRDRDILYEVSHDPAGAGQPPRLSVSLTFQGLASHQCIKYGDLKTLFSTFPRYPGSMPFSDEFILRTQEARLNILSFSKESSLTSCVTSLDIIQLVFDTR